MTLYSNSAFDNLHPVKKMAFGVTPLYLFGSFCQDQTPFRFSISQVALTSNVATITVAIKGGGGLRPQDLPLVGAKMGVRGTTTSSGLYNVDPATVTATTVDSTGGGTISFALTHANVAAVADVGELIVQPYEVADLVAAGSVSAPVALSFSPDDSDNSRCLFAEARWTGTIPTAATVVLQVANVDDDGDANSSPVRPSRYYVMKNTIGMANAASVAASDALATIAGSAVTQAGAEYSFVLGKFIRAKVLSMTGGDGTTALVVTLFP